MRPYTYKWANLADKLCSLPHPRGSMTKVSSPPSWAPGLHKLGINIVGYHWSWSSWGQPHWSIIKAVLLVWGSCKVPLQVSSCGGAFRGRVDVGVPLVNSADRWHGSRWWSNYRSAMNDPIIVASFWSLTGAVVAFGFSSHCLQHPATSYGFFGGKVPRRARTNVLQMVLNPRLHPHLPF